MAPSGESPVPTETAASTRRLFWRAPLVFAYLLGAPLAVCVIVVGIAAPARSHAGEHPLLWRYLLPLLAVLFIIASIRARRALRELAASSAPCVGPLSAPISGQYIDHAIMSRTLLCAWKAADWVPISGLALGAAAYPWILRAIYPLRRPGLLPISSLITIALLVVAIRITKAHWHWLAYAFVFGLIANVSFAIVGAEIPADDNWWILYFLLCLFGGLPAVLPLVGLVALAKTWRPYFTRDETLQTKVAYACQALLWLTVYPFFLAALALTSLVWKHKEGLTVDYITLSLEPVRPATKQTVA